MRPAASRARVAGRTTGGVAEVGGRWPTVMQLSCSANISVCPVSTRRALRGSTLTSLGDGGPQQLRAGQLGEYASARIEHLHTWHVVVSHEMRSPQT